MEFQETKMDGVTEYAENMPVSLAQTEGDWRTADEPELRVGHGRWVVQAYNEGGCNLTHVDVVQLLKWLMMYRPDLLAAAKAQFDAEAK